MLAQTPFIMLVIFCQFITDAYNNPSAPQIKFLPHKLPNFSFYFTYIYIYIITTPLTNDKENLLV